jgi:hypothetical protein
MMDRGARERMRAVEMFAMALEVEAGVEAASYCKRWLCLFTAPLC